MSYEIILSDTAREDLRALPDAVRGRVVQHLEAGLANYPTELSRPSRFPYWQKCQLFQVDVDDDTERWEITVLFQYAADEQHIQVLAIGRFNYPLSQEFNYRPRHDDD